MRGQRIKASRLVLTVILWSCVLTAAPASAQAPEGEMRWALYVTISPTWFDPGESGVAGLNSFWIGYALHDALVKPMPGNPRSPSLAESWTLSADRRVYDFKLREGVKFHNGDPFTAEDVKFTFLRYRWATKASGSIRSASGPISSSATGPASSWSWRPSRRTGAKSLTSSAWS